MEAYSCEERKEIIDTDIPAAPGLIGHEDLWERNVKREADSYSCGERKESIGRNSLIAKEKIEFRPGRNPKEAIEGDLIRFLHKNHDNNSVSWVQGR